MFDWSKLSTKVAAALATAAAVRDAMADLPDAVSAAEAFIGPGNGAGKLEMVKARLIAFLTTLGHGLDAIGAAMPIIVTFITTLVRIASDLGIGPFAKKA